MFISTKINYCQLLPSTQPNKNEPVSQPITQLQQPIPLLPLTVITNQANKYKQSN